MTALRFSVSLCLCVFVSVRAHAQGSPHAKPNVLLITVDTLRPDALGWAGGKNATPNIDALARESFRFPGAVAEVPLTLPSHSALMTGWWPRRLGLRDNGQLVPPSVPTLAEAFKRAGYQTAAFVSGYPLDSAFGLDRGFDVYDDHFVRGAEGDLERPADATAAAFLAWLKTARAPWFAWVHFYDAHYPYEPPASYRRPGRRGAYDGEVAFVDAAIGTVRAALPASPGPLLTVFAADHGESLGEHAEGTHGFFIYDSTVLVPLLFHFPGRIAPASSTMPARLIDVAPTVLRLVGVAAPGATDGVSIDAHLLGGRARPEPSYIETQQPWVSYGWAPLRALRHDGWKLVEAPRPELYDLTADPGETRNVIQQNGARAEPLRRLLERAESLPAVDARTLDDPAAMERLRALGYVGGAPPAAVPRAGLRDPKDGAALRELLTRGDELFRRREYAAALAPLEQALAEEKDNRFALHRAGVALTELGRLPRALPLLERLVALDPRNPDAQVALADALVRARRPGDAVPHWLEATRLQPRRADLWANLGSAMGMAGREREAAGALAEAVRLSPRDPRLLIRLGFAEHGAGRPADAVKHLLAAADLTGAAAFPQPAALGILLAQLGRGDEARAWLGRATPQEGDFAEARFQLAVVEAAKGRAEAARSALSDALRAAPALRARAQADPRLAALLP
jgi:arylsulfatase A-like enzyme/Flp pilus assembly protein TadD